MSMLFERSDEEMATAASLPLLFAATSRNAARDVGADVEAQLWRMKVLAPSLSLFDKATAAAAAAAAQQDGENEQRVMASQQAGAGGGLVAAEVLEPAKPVDLTPQNGGHFNERFVVRFGPVVAAWCVVSLCFVNESGVFVRNLY
jgi:hypothetical protein